MIQAFQKAFGIAIAYTKFGTQRITAHRSTLAAVQIILEQITHGKFLLRTIFMVTHLSQSFQNRLRLRLLHAYVIIGSCLTLGNKRLPCSRKALR